MTGVSKIWKNFLTSVISETFGDFIDSKEIENRSTWILSKINSIAPELLFKNLLYMMNNNPVSKMAIGYKLRFLEDDYKEVFINPFTEEFDNNDSLKIEDKELLNELIENLMISINHHIEMLIVGSENTNLLDTIKELSSHYNIPNIESHNDKMIRESNLIYFMSSGQFLYMAVFNQNPFSGLPCSTSNLNMIKTKFPYNFKAMEMLKIRWSTGIPLKYVLCRKLF